MGRPTKLTPLARERFIQAIKAGAFPEPAARYAGFSPASLYRYLKGSSPDHAAFRDEVHAALAGLELRLTGTIAQAAFSDPKWALTLLERRFPERWRPRSDRADAEPGTDGATATVAPTPIVLDPALLEELVPRLLDAGRERSGSVVIDAVPIERFELVQPAGREREDER